MLLMCPLHQHNPATKVWVVRCMVWEAIHKGIILRSLIALTSPNQALFQGIPSASQTLTTSYFSDAGSDGYRTGSSVSRRSHAGNPAGNTPVGSKLLGLGFGPNILNLINPNRKPQGNGVPQGNVPPPVQHNVVPLAQPQPIPQPVNVPDNNPGQPLRQALPPAYQDYRLDANPGQPASIPPVQDNPPLYRPPYGPNPPGDPPGWSNPNWNIPWGYPQQQHQYPNHQWDPHHQRDPKLSKYDGSLPWHDYKVKLEHMAQQYGWDDNKKLAKLVEAIEGKALSYYGALDELICRNYQQVSLKFNA